MTPERWQRAQEVFVAATEREPAMRGAYLDEECRSDPELRNEVESLLSSYQAAPSGFLESPAVEDVSAVSPADWSGTLGDTLTAGNRRRGFRPSGCG